VPATSPPIPHGYMMKAEPPTAFLMSVSCISDYDLLCADESSGILSGDSPECSSDVDSTSPPPSPLPSSEDYSIASFIEHERNFVPGFDYLSRYQSRSLDADAREESVAWILKVHAYYGFQPLTAYLAVNYMDRFMDSRQLPQTNGWPLQLLSVACLSLAAKMEEPLVPSLLDLQIEGAKYLFEPRTIQAGFLAYRPSCIAAAAILSAAKEIPNWAVLKPEHAESWCEGLRKEKIIACYQLMQELVVNSNRRKLPLVLPQLRVTTRTRMRSSVSSFSSSSSFSLSCKRRKLNNCLWVDDKNSE
ncbi:hypothetical protein V8G54_001941, partial [Vigna mungo]